MSPVLRHSGVWIVTAVVFALLPILFDSGYALTLLCRIGVLIIFALAYNMLLGQGGMLSFGHAIFFGLAGYFVIHVLNWMGDDEIPYIPVSLLPLVGGVVGLFFGVLVGYVSTKRAGTTFAMISLGFGELVTALTLVFVAFFNGEEGIQADRWVGPEPLGITFGPQIQIYYLIAVWCLVCMIAMYLLTKTPFGRMCNAVRDNPERAQFVGYSTRRVRWLAFSLSSFFAGIAGSLHALNYEHVGFDTVGAAQSGFVLFMTYIGGAGNFLGPIVGAVLISYLQGVLSDLSEAWVLYLGLLFLAIVLFAPGGIAGLILMHEPIWKIDVRLLRGLVLPYLAAIGATLVLLTGIVGVIEMIYFVTVISLGESEMSLYGIAISVASPVPWVACGAVALAGVYLCRLAYPVSARSWNAAIAEARHRLVT